MMSKNSSLTFQHHPPLKVHNALRDFLIKVQMADADGSQDADLVLDEAHCSFVTAEHLCKRMTDDDRALLVPYCER